MNMKWRFTAAATVLVVAVLTIPLWGDSVKSVFHSDAVHAADPADGAVDQHIITVTGHGEMKVDPDVAYITFGVQSEADSANEAQTANAQDMDKIIQALKEKYNIEDKDIKSTDFSVQPRYQYDNGEKPKITGYIARHNIQITYRNLDNIGKLLDAVSAAGANQVNGVRFSTEKDQAYELQVLKKAMDNARAKAEVLAESAGKELKEVINISQSGGGGIPITYAGREAFNLSAKVAADSAASTSISSGQLEINTSITVQFSF